MAQDVVVGFECWRLRHPLFEGGRHVRLGIAERAVTVLQPVEVSVNDRNDIDTRSPRPARLKVQFKLRPLESDGKVLAEFDHGVAPEGIARISQCHLAGAEVGA